MKQSCTIEMNMKTIFFPQLNNLSKFLKGINPTRRCKVFYCKNCLFWSLHIFDFANVCFNISGWHKITLITGNSPGHHSGQSANTPVFICDNMALITENDLCTWLPCSHNRDVVAENTRYYKTCGSFSKKLSSHFLKLQYIEVFSIEMVCIVSIQYCLPHWGCHVCSRIWANIDKIHSWL